MLTLRQVYDFFSALAFYNYLRDNSIKTVSSVEIRNFNRSTGEAIVFFRFTETFDTADTLKAFNEDALNYALKDQAFADFILAGVSTPRDAYMIVITGDGKEFVIDKLPEESC